MLEGISEDNSQHVAEHNTQHDTQHMDQHMAADLSLKNSAREKRMNSDSEAIDSSIDLSVKRRALNDRLANTARCEESVTTNVTNVVTNMGSEEASLDLSMPTSSTTCSAISSTTSSAVSSSTPSVPVKSETNRRTQQLSFPQQIANISVSNWSSSESESAEALVSDDECDHMTNGHTNGVLVSDDDLAMPPSPKLKQLTNDELKAKEKRMRQLKQELRNEEMKLVLLKKLRQSQLMKENIVNNLSSTASNPSVNASNLAHSTKMVNYLPQMRNGSTALQPSSQSQHRSIQNKSSSVLNPPIARNSQNIAPIGPPQIGMGAQKSASNLMMHHSNHSTQSSSLRPLSSLNRTPVTTPPNVVLGYPVPEIRAQQQSSSILNSHSQTANQMGVSSNGSPGPSSGEMNQSLSQAMSQTPAQRQAAAKLALRKQLEKTLLQIPPPKPPPPEMHFIPNANNQEFVYYLGLETVVDFLTDSPNQNRPPPDPFECVQCGTDFTPVWKWQDRIDPNRDRPAVICETCVTSNIKKALKAEHTNRLKTAFVKALQQEQEIEQRIASGAVSPPLPSISPPMQQNSYSSHQNVSVTSPLVTSSQSMLPQAPPAHSSLPRLSGSAAGAAAAAAAAVANSAALLQQMPKLSAAHQSLFAAQAQKLHQLAQSLPQPQPAHMLPFAPLLAAQAYSYGMLGNSGGVSSTDLHRQYLLDMIPSRSLPQGSINWKT